MLTAAACFFFSLFEMFSPWLLPNHCFSFTETCQSGIAGSAHNAESACNTASFSMLRLSASKLVAIATRRYGPRMAPALCVPVGGAGRGISLRARWPSWLSNGGGAPCVAVRHLFIQTSPTPNPDSMKFMPDTGRVLPPEFDSALVRVGGAAAVQHTALIRSCARGSTLARASRRARRPSPRHCCGLRG